METAIRLIALDLDGTLLNGKGAVSKRDAAALRKAASMGIHLAVNSGRAPFEIDYLLKPVLELPWHYISLNDALIKTAGRPAMISRLTKAQFLRCWALCKEYGSQCFFYDKHREYSNRVVDESRPPYPRRIREEEMTALSEHVAKFVFHSEDSALLQSLRKQLEPEGLSIQSSWHTNFEVNAPGVNKGAGLAILAGILGVDMDDTMALGDQENDLPMLQRAGIPIAMGNAIPAVKGLATHGTLSNLEDGVALAIHEMIR